MFVFHSPQGNLQLSPLNLRIEEKQPLLLPNFRVSWLSSLFCQESHYQTKITLSAFPVSKFLYKGDSTVTGHSELWYIFCG